ncbi:hypothetical protein HXX76_012480 [Chlamydomonas incerta]|uniref:Uncharacterized protein n=1 Tax=Chlamydomonas incerta TaxID=51695 RepID=A0A835SHV7_CHLIN|nr:hypothetical protein HXX76_012480 [Chlamydomonas incerta]|eukprot:KAG2427284.1 hypothetical protein HXX76_012480 [Chlamydomonas incerta]
MFENRVFAHMALREPKYQQALAAGAEPCRTAADVVRMLASMSFAEEEGDEDSAAVHLTSTNLLIRAAWHDAVTAKGLTPEEYDALCAFRAGAGRSPHPPCPPAEALRLLATSPGLPQEYTPFKQPLMKLLRLLTGA